MQITEVQITEGDNVIMNAGYCPTGTDLSTWLGKIVTLFVNSPPATRMIEIPGTGYTVDRRLVTEVKVTMET